MRIFESCSADIGDIGEDPGHRVLRVVEKGAMSVPLPPSVGRAIDRAVGDPVSEPFRVTNGDVG